MIGISSVLAGLVKNYGFENRLLEHNLRLGWKGIVGKTIAAHAIPFRIQYRRLYLWVDSSAWLDQLTLLKPDLLMKINAFLKNQFFKDIIFRIGHSPIPLPETRSQDQKPLTVLQELTPELELCIEEYLKTLEDPGLKEIVRRTMIKCFTAASTAC